MPEYAKDTKVSSGQSKTEIERILQRYGASAFMYGWDGPRAVIGFEINGRRYRVLLPLPDRNDYLRTEVRRQRRSEKEIDAAYEQAVRQRWRAMALWIKATLEATETGIITIQEALQPFTVLPNGQTVGDWLRPQLAAVYESGKMPPMLPAPKENE